MSSLTYVNTYTYSVTFVTDKMLTSLKRIIVLSGLDPGKLTSDWAVLERGISTWLRSKHLERVILEVYRAGSATLVGRWDFDIEYGYGADGDGEMWTDPDAIRHAINKCGINPSGCEYRIMVTTKPGSLNIDDWGPGSFLSTEGFVRHSVGTTIGANPLATRTAYWRKV